MEVPRVQQSQTLFDQALLLDESDSMFSFLDQMAAGGELAEAAVGGSLLYGAPANLGDAALAGAVGDPVAWGDPGLAAPWASTVPLPLRGGHAAPEVPASPLNEERQQQQQPSGSGSGERSSGDGGAAEPKEAAGTSSSKRSDGLKSKAERLHLAREKARPHPLLRLPVRRRHLRLGVGDEPPWCVPVRVRGAPKY